MYDLWAGHPFGFPILQFEFVNILDVMLKAIFALRNINIKTIEQLTATR